MEKYKLLNYANLLNIILDGEGPPPLLNSAHPIPKSCFPHDQFFSFFHFLSHYSFSVSCPTPIPPMSANVSFWLALAHPMYSLPCSRWMPSLAYFVGALVDWEIHASAVAESHHSVNVGRLSLVLPWSNPIGAVHKECLVCANSRPNFITRTGQDGLPVIKGLHKLFSFQLNEFKFSAKERAVRIGQWHQSVQMAVNKMNGTNDKVNGRSAQTGGGDSSTKENSTFSSEEEEEAKPRGRFIFVITDFEQSQSERKQTNWWGIF